MRQPLVAPTSMYSMKRSTTPRALEVARHRQDLVLVGAALDHHVDLDRARGRPRARRRCPRSTSATGKSTSFMRRNTASSSASRLTVTRCRPGVLQRLRLARQQRAVGGRASGRAAGRRACAAAASCSTSISRFLRSSGSPPVRRILRTPCATNMPRHARDLLEGQQRRHAAGTGSPCRTLPWACSSCSGSCSGR